MEHSGGVRDTVGRYKCTMKSRNGYTLIELLVVIVVVGILAAVVVPMMQGRIDSARWSEGRAMMGTIARALRAHIGEEGVKALKEFVEKGGTLVTLGEACTFAIEKFKLSVRNSVEDLSQKEFFCPGSTLKVTFDNRHKLAYGMPSEGLILFWNSSVFEVIPGQHNERYETIVRYIDRDILRSGWLIGEKYL